MVSKNSEARKCVNTNRASIENNRVGNIDMNSVQNKELSFHNVTLVPAPVADGIWLTSSDIAKALGYASPKSVTNIYSRNADEFTGSMSMVIKMMTNGINNNLREKSVRVFSLRGCHLIAMFAATDKAKEFRRWVLDILDRDVAQTPESSPIHRFHAKVIIKDNVFGGEVEFYGKAENLNALATGICSTLGFEPSGFKQIPMDTKRIRRIH